MSTVLQFMLLLAIIVAAAKVAGYISTRLGQPAVLGELLAGVILGPSLINLYALPFIGSQEAVYFEKTFAELAELGVVLLMFMAGLETNLRDMARQGRVAIFGGVMGVIFPIALGGLVAAMFGNDLTHAVFIGIILSATSVSISAQTLLELGVLRRREGVALLGAAVLDDVLVILVLSVFIALLGSGGGVFDIVIVIARMVGFFVVAGLFSWKVLPWLLNRFKRLPVSESLAAGTFVVIVLMAWSAEFMGGVALITGAFLAGIAIGQTPFQRQLQEKFHPITYTIFVPIFFVSVGLSADIKTLTGSVWVFAVAIILIAIVSKMLGSGLGAKLAGFDWLASSRLGLGMVSRGEVGLIVAEVGRSRGLISSEVYAVMVVMVLATTLFTPFALKLAYRGENKTPTQPERSLVAATKEN